MSRQFEDLQPIFQPIARAILGEARRRGIDARLGDTWRTRPEQAAREAAGDSKVKLGWHNVGLAFDFLIFRGGRYIADGNDPQYAEVGEIGRSKGCVWGGDWDIRPDIPGKQRDAGHLEWHPGFSFQLYLSWLNTHSLTVPC